MDHFAGEPTGAMFAIAVARGAKAERRIGFVDGWQYLPRPPFEDKGTGEVVSCWSSNRGASTFCVICWLPFLVLDWQCVLLLVQFGLGLFEVFSLQEWT